VSTPPEGIASPAFWVEIDGHKAILKGTVRSYAELEDVERAVRNVSGIREVENHLTVDPNIFIPA
jgi:osmotically-inducible protein OsmY